MASINKAETEAFEYEAVRDINLIEEEITVNIEDIIFESKDST